MKLRTRIIALLLGAIMLFSFASCQNESSDDTDTSDTADTSEDTTDTEEEDALKEIVATEDAAPIQLTWHQGYIGSSDHETSPLAIADGEDYYSYTDVFCIKKAGTTIQFLDDNQYAGENPGKAADDILVLSSWVEKDGEWVIDKFGPQYAGSSASNSDIVSYQNKNILYTYTTTNDNEYFRICYHSGETADFKPTAHIEVTAQLTGDPGTARAYINKMEWVKESSKTSYYEILEGLTINAIGDSYIASNDKEIKWPELMNRKYSLDLHNYGIGGCSVSNFITDRNPMCERYTSMLNNDPDIVIVEGGRNDFNNKVPVGSVNSTDTKTYSGALNVIIDGLQEKYPNAMFVCISVWNFPDTAGNELTHEDYVNAMKAVAEAQGAYFFDSSDVSITGVDMSNALFRSQYCRNPDDPSHLNNEGSKLFFPIIEKKLAEFYTDFLSKQQ